MDHLVLWLRADLGVTSQGGVTLWKDQVGNDDAFQSTASSRPKVVADYSNGKPVVEFDGDDDYLELNASDVDYSGGVTMFLVAESSGDAFVFGKRCPSLLYFSNGGDDGHAQAIAVSEASGLNAAHVAYTVGSEYLESWGGSMSGRLHRLGIVQLQDTAYLGVDGAVGPLAISPDGTPLVDEDPLFALPAAGGHEQRFIGKNLFKDSGQACDLFAGKIGEILVYNRTLDPDEWHAMHEYLKLTWDID